LKQSPQLLTSDSSCQILLSNSDFLIFNGITNQFTISKDFHVHPCIKESGWLAFIERYLDLSIKADGLQAVRLQDNEVAKESYRSLEAPLWDVTTDTLIKMTVKRPPKIFWDWSKKLDQLSDTNDNAVASTSGGGVSNPDDDDFPEIDDDLQNASAALMEVAMTYDN
jgi:hypothetical protein